MTTTRIRKEATKLCYVFVLLSLLKSNLGPVSVASAQGNSATIPILTATNTNTRVVDTPINTENEILQSNSTYIDPQGIFYFEYPLEWSMEEEQRNDDKPETFDLDVTLTTEDNGMILLHMWRNVEPSGLSLISEKYLYPILSSTTEKEYYQGLIQDNELLIAIENDTAHLYPTSVYAIFECNNSVFMFQYIAADSGINREAFKNLLSSFSCKDHLDAINEIPLFLAEEFVSLDVNSLSNDSCAGHWDPTGNTYTCGQCTWWASYSRPDIPNFWGNAETWDNKAEIKWGRDWISENPEPGSIAVWDPYALPGMGAAGHVAYVTWVYNDSSFLVTEMNADNKGSLRTYKHTNSSKVHFILAGVTLYSNKNFDGELTRLRASIPNLLIWGNEVSSIFIPAGWDTLFFKNSNYVPFSYRHRWGGTDLDALESSFWDLSLDYFSDGSIMDHNIRSIILSHTSCLLDPSMSSVQGELLNPIESESTCSAPTPPPSPNPEPPPGTIDSATFVADVTIPDGTVVTPGQGLVKTWRVKNSGTSTWGSGYQLVFTGGEQMGAPNALNVPATAPGQTADISVSMTAPATTGSHTGYWRLRNPQGTYFGPKIQVSINVQTSNPGSGNITLFDVTPPSPSSASQVHIVGRARYFTDFRSMRFVIGNEVMEMTNIRQVGDQMEISADWNTASLPRGDYAIVFEVAKNGDPDWENAERQVKTYTLTGTPSSDNHPPDRPILQSPYNWYLKDAAGSPAPVESCVYPSSDPDGNPVQYYFEVKDQGGGVYANSGWTSNACWTRTYDPNTYSWRVKAGDGSAESDWSTDTWNFTVAKGGVYIGDHTIFSPNTNDTHVCVFITYDGIQGPEVYAWLNRAPDGSENGEWRLLDHYGPNTTPDCTQPNYHGFWIRSPEYETGTHKLRISAVKRDSGANAKKDTSYTIAYIRPSDVKLLAPSTPTNNGTWWNTRTIHFEWSPSLRAENYILRASTNSNPWADPSPVLNQVMGSGITSYDHTFGQDYAKLYWSVRASNSAGSTDSGPDVWFGIDLVKPSCQVQSLPATTYETVFQVNWSGNDNSAGMRSYDVQYRDSSRDAWNDWLLNQFASRPYELFIGMPGHTYEFRCRATDNADNTGDYPADPDTSIKIDPAARPPSPWWDTAYTLKRNVIVLNNMAGMTLPTGYPVHLHFDSGTTPTAAELFNASQSTPKCNDLRVVYNDAVELDRLVDHCDSSAIDLWFRTQVSVSGGASNSTAHQLYYGNASASSPPTNRSHIFYPSIDSNHLRVFDMREGTGLTLYDATGNGNATMSGELSWTSSGKFGPAVLIPGDQTPEPRPAIYAGYGPQPDCNFTAELWLKRLSGHNYGGQLMQQEIGGPNPWRWAFMLDGDKLKLSVEGTADHVFSNAGLGPSTYFDSYHHIAVTHSCSGEVRFYIDGVLDSVRTMSNGNVNPASAPLRIGNNAYNTQRIAGYVFGAALSNVVRTDFTYGQFGSITSEPSVATGLPVDPPNSGFADLAILELSAFPNPTGGILVQAVVENQGNLDTLNGFFTDLYVDHIPTGSGDYTGSLQFWVNDPIAASATVTLTTVITNLPSQSSSYIQGSNLINETIGTLYAQTDSAGVIGEPNETDNIYSSGIDVCLATTDAYESDDNAGTASIISLGQTQTHNFNHMGDQDWIKFSVQEGETYTLRTLNLGASADTYLYLYDTDGITLLASNDDYGGTLASQIEWIAPSTGTFYVQIQHWNPNIGGCSTAYDFVVVQGEVCFLLSTSINPSEAGTITPDITPNCEGGKYLSGTEVQLTATANTGYVFINWSGDASGSANPTTVTMTTDTSVTANFVQNPTAFVKVNPSNGATAVFLSPTLRWGSSIEPARYEYCYDTTDDNNCDGMWVGNGYSTSANISGLNYGTYYYWQVRAITFGTEYADEGTWWVFMTIYSMFPGSPPLK